MPLTRIACPECGSALTSAAGYTVGRTTTCGKCEAEFVVADPAMVGGRDEPDAPPMPKEWSYRTSTLRYVVLTLLLGVMGVLGYLLYDKKSKERAADRDGGLEGDEARLIDPAKIKVTVPLGPDGQPRDITLRTMIPAGVPGATGGPTVRAADVSKAVVGKWEWKGDGESATMEYKADGSFVYTATGGAKPVEGRWSVGAVEQPAENAPMVLPFQWKTVETTATTATFSPLPNATLSLAGGNTLEKHPLLHKPNPDAAGTFVKK